MERRAQAAEASCARTSGRVALGHAIRAAELYMEAAGETSDKAGATRLRSKCQELIALAEKLKRRQETATALTPPQSDILLGALRLHGNVFPPWNCDPDDDEFELNPSSQYYTDEAPFTLSATQAQNFKAWIRPAELFGLAPDRDKSQDENILMQVRGHCDLVQDITTDCSVVASLSAAAKVMIGPHAVLSTILYPFDHAKGRPKLSRSGKYVIRMNFNGCPRRVVVDDRLPASRTDRTLFVVDRRNPCLLWPALLEKAYLKVRGGYDFPGSNSGTDLWVLTGWIPEQLFLQVEDLDYDETWARVKAAHESRDVIVTLGTGRISAEEERLMGLIGEHDYAVEDLEMPDGNTRKLLIKNPWRDAPLIVGTGGPDSGRDNTTWITLEDVAQHFETMYLNWNPSLFTCRQDHHLTWELPPRYLATSLVKNPQYALSSASGGSIWVLVGRHFVDAELEIARSRHGSLAAVARQLGFMSILIFDNGGKRAHVSGSEIYRGPYVDSPQTLARLEASPGKRYTMVIDQQELPLPNYSLTLTLFSNTPLQVKLAEERMYHNLELTGAWSRRNAGGNSSKATYYRNPQYKLVASKTTPLSILLSTDNREVQVHVDVVWARGQRVTTVRVKDLVFSSGEYHRGCAMATIPKLEPGTYTLVCSTFDAGQTAAFAIQVSSMSPVSLDPLPAEAAGRLRTPLATFKPVRGEGGARAPLMASWLTRASISVYDVQLPDAADGARHASSVLLRVSVVQGWGPEQVTVATSGNGQFRKPAADLRTGDFDVEPDKVQREGMWLVIECLGSHQALWAVDGEILSDSPIQVGVWQSL
ncbi:cysteine protease PalB [Ophiocordyceps camponoti-floridani]|uniref:Cysteine protease PalB n=1 Tax=Ophiocordyceps camponoti-floridani TaxID=2030778 RepID=A0A8H4Q6D7_9HYPO|nr:cysteine protease PalB [Ophiocordyceps camponoti-floridani]